MNNSAAGKDKEPTTNGDQSASGKIDGSVSRSPAETKPKKEGEKKVNSSALTNSASAPKATETVLRSQNNADKVKANPSAMNNPSANKDERPKTNGEQGGIGKSNGSAGKSPAGTKPKKKRERKIKNASVTNDASVPKMADGQSQGNEMATANQHVNADDKVKTSTRKKHKYRKRVKKTKIPFGERGINPLTNKQYSLQYHNLLAKREKLPIWEYKSTFMDSLNKNKFLLLVSETGSGKTTQVPQWCVEYCLHNNLNGVVACTQPRRVAATSVADRVAKEMDVRLGEEVGYKIRFEDLTTEVTALKYTTDGLLVREAMIDTQLKDYGVIIIDEAHERTCSTDMLLGLLKESKRTDLKVIIMSATLEVKKFQDYFYGAPLIEVPGRTYPIDIVYEPRNNSDYLTVAIDKVAHIHTTEKKKGDILVFLTGKAGIRKACKRVKNMLLENNYGELECIPLYSALPMQEQKKAFKPPPKDKPGGLIGRKVVFATNIAETSLTIDGIGFVVDCGYSKQIDYNPMTRVSSLQVKRISQLNAKQRAGRAGRTGPGKCYRLYSQEMHDEELKKSTNAEILCTNLASVVLILKKLGKDPLTFDYLDQPDPEALQEGIDTLTVIGALDGNAELTNLGELMVQFPLDPLLSRMLISSSEYNCTDEILTIAAMLSVPPCFNRPTTERQLADDAKMSFVGSASDHLSLLRVYDEYALSVQNQVGRQWCFDNYVNHRSLENAYKIRSQIKKIANKLGLHSRNRIKDKLILDETIRKVITSAFFMNVAYRVSSEKHVTFISRQNVEYHPSSCADRSAEWVVYNDCSQTTRLFLRIVSGIESEWLHEFAPQIYTEDTIRQHEIFANEILVQEQMQHQLEQEILSGTI